MQERLDPIRKEVDVPVPVVDAFRAFTEDIDRWWPLASHSIAQENATGCHIDGGPGGGLFETAGGGTRYRWGTIMTWQPPHRLSFTWHPGRQPDDHTLVELQFIPLDEQRTRVVLIHSGWQTGDEERHRAYVHGWDEVLRQGYAAYVARG